MKTRACQMFTSLLLSTVIILCCQLILNLYHLDNRGRVYATQTLERDHFSPAGKAFDYSNNHMFKCPEERGYVRRMLKFPTDGYFRQDTLKPT